MNRRLFSKVARFSFLPKRNSQKEMGGNGNKAASSNMMLEEWGIEAVSRLEENCFDDEGASQDGGAARACLALSKRYGKRTEVPRRFERLERARCVLAFPFVGGQREESQEMVMMFTES